MSDPQCSDASIGEDTEPSGRAGDFSNDTDVSSPGDEFGYSFPREDFYCLVEALSQVHMCPLPTHNLQACTSAASALLKRLDRAGPGEVEYLRRFTREVLPQCMDACFRDPALQRYSEQSHQHLFHCLIDLGELTIEQLKLSMQHDTWLEAADDEQDSMYFLQSLSWGFNSRNPFHEHWHRHGTLLRVTGPQYATAEPSTSMATLDAEGTGQVDQTQYYQYAWLVHLINNFGASGGFEQIYEMLKACSSFSLALLDYLLYFLMEVSDHMLPERLQEAEEGLLCLLQHLQDVVLHDEEKLCNQGKDRTYMHLSRMLDHLYQLFVKGQMPPVQADDKVATVQRAFVGAMLSSSNFNKLLSAVRECRKLLSRAREIARHEKSETSWKVSMEWLDRADVVKLMLRSNLHQRQYVEQVGGIIALLAEGHGLQDLHLEMLWNVTEQDGTFDTVKTNVYNMLAESAPFLLPTQLDWLFCKFSVNRDRPVADTLRILELLRRLAATDLEDGHMATKLMNLMWDMMVSADAPRELLESKILSKVLTDYDSAGGQHDLVRRCLLQCMKELQERRNIYPALRLICMLISQAPRDPRGADSAACSKRALIEFLVEEQQDAPRMLIRNLHQLMLCARQALASTDPPGVPPGQGIYSYQEIIEGHLDLLRLLGLQHLDLPLMEQLWDLLIVEPVTPKDAQGALQWFTQCGQLHVRRGVGDELAECCRQLLVDRITAMPPQGLTLHAWRCFKTFFELVNMTEGKLELSMDDPDSEVMAVSLDLTGLDYLWEVVLSTTDRAVFEEAQPYLIDVYHGMSPEPVYCEPHQLSTTDAHRAFVEECVRRLLEMVAGLQEHQQQHQQQQQEGAAGAAGAEQQGPSQPGDTQAGPSMLRVTHCLALLTNMVRKTVERTLPPVPMHQATYRGMPLQIDAQPQTAGKFRLEAHTNQYIGLLRRSLAARLGQPPQRLRIITTGKELGSDSDTLAMIGSRGGRSGGLVLQITLSNMDNNFTQPPDDYLSTWSKTAPVAMLSQTESVYDALLLVADLPWDTTARNRATNLLQLLPTWPRIRTQLAAALSSPDPSAPLRDLLLGPSPDAPVRPPEVLYKLQALYGMLFPPYDGGELDGEYDRALAAAPMLQAAFVSRNCAPLLFQAVQQACERNRSDVAFQRSMNTIMVMIINSLRATITSGTAPVTEENSDTEGGPRSVQQDDMAADGSPVPEAPAVEEAGPQLDYRVFQMMVTFLVNLVASAGTYWTGRVPGPREIMEERLVREALAALLPLLRQDKEQLLPTFLHDTPSHRLIGDLLLNRYSHNMRVTAADFLDALGLAVDEPEVSLWLLQQLAAHRTQAQQLGVFSEQYWRLFSKAVAGLEKAPTAEQCAFADTLLDQELAALHQLDRASASGRQEDWDVVLEGRLLLVLALVRALDRRSAGAQDEGGLLALLLTRHLFPEAALIAQYDCLELVPVHLVPTVLDTPCSSPACRKAAFRLVADLMTHCVRNLEEGAALLRRLHLRGTGVTRWDLQPVAQLRAGCGYIGLKNAGATCYMNAVFQQLFMQPRIRELVLGAAEVPDAEKQDSLFHQLQIMFGYMALSRNSYYVPRGFWAAFMDYDGQPIDVREHQDAYEFFTRLQDLVDQHLRSCQQQPAMQAVLGGRFVQQIICRDINYRSEREEEFYQISVDVRGKGSLEASLESYVQGELMEGDNAYLCEHVGRRVAALKRSCIKELPHTLGIHLKRFEFDYHTMNRNKVRDRFEFPLRLDMFRYTADGLEVLEGKQGASALPEHPRAHYLYELKGIVVHSGSAFTGHYYSYIKERPGSVPPAAGAEASERGRSDQWFCFDDKCVRPWDVDQLEADCFGGTFAQDAAAAPGPGPKPRQDIERPHSAFMLFYERCEPPPPPPPAPAAAAAAPPAAAAAAAAAPATSDVTMASTPTAGAAQPRPAATISVAPTPSPSPSPAAAAPADSMDTATTPTTNPSAAPPASPLPRGPVPILSTPPTFPRGGGGPTAPTPPGSAHSLSPAPAPPAPPPYGMPTVIYETVMRDNLQLVYRQHQLDREYFATVRSIIECKWDHLRSSRKSRRTDGASGSGTTGSGRTAATAAASMSVDTATHHDAASGAGAAGAAAGGGGAGGDTAAGGVGGPGGGGLPVSRRNGEVIRAKGVSVQLATEFLLKVYWQAHPSLRQDAHLWEEAITSLTQLPPTAKAFLETLQRNNGHLQSYYLACPSAAVRSFLSATTGTCLAAMYQTQQQMAADEDHDPTYYAAMNAIWRELHRMLTLLASEPHHEPEAVLNTLLTFARVGHPVTGALLLQDDVLRLLVVIVDRIHPSNQNDDVYVEEMLLAYRLIHAIITSHVELHVRPPPNEIMKAMYDTLAATPILRRGLDHNSLYSKTFATGFAYAWMRLDEEAFRLGMLVAHNNELLTAFLVAACMDQVGQAPSDEDIGAQLIYLSQWLCSSILPDDRLGQKRIDYLLGGIPGTMDGLLGVVQQRHTPKRRLQLLEVLRRLYFSDTTRGYLTHSLDSHPDHGVVLQRVHSWLQQLQPGDSRDLLDEIGQIGQLLDLLQYNDE